MVYGIFPLNMWDFISVGILHAPTLFWVRNLKGRYIRPYPIKLGRICMHREKSVFVIFSYHVIWSKQKIIWTKTQTTHLLFTLAVMHLTKHDSGTKQEQAIDDSQNIEWTLNIENPLLTKLYTFTLAIECSYT